ncbi:unnamed protein product [Hyaloperonospora brassicae]|uniref:RxLR effector candidate protein n=1 Tax=Hyaloperonospora brassicae TaxID=162125 RepID=A0AAV0UBG7_HYABA|nr:unnamed protein product [Hyaloperonospora brassicae]
MTQLRTHRARCSRPTKSGGLLGDMTGRKDHEQGERASVVGAILYVVEPVLMAKDRVATRIRHYGIGSKYTRLGLHKGDVNPDDIANRVSMDRQFIHPNDGVHFHKQVVKVFTDHHSVTDVVKKLISIQGRTTSGTSEMLQRLLASRYRDHPDMLDEAWLALELDPKNLHELLGLGKFMALRDNPDSGIAWLKFNELLMTNGKNNAMNDEGAVASYLYKNKSPNEIDAFIEKGQDKKGRKGACQNAA